MNLIDRNLIKEKEYRDNIPKNMISVFYDADDRVLMGNSIGKGLVTYEYVPEKYSLDGKPIYLGWTISYDGKGLKNCPDKSKIKTFNQVKEFFE